MVAAGAAVVADGEVVVGAVEVVLGATLCVCAVAVVAGAADVEVLVEGDVVPAELEVTPLEVVGGGGALGR